MAPAVMRPSLFLALIANAAAAECQGDVCSTWMAITWVIIFLLWILPPLLFICLACRGNRAAGLQHVATESDTSSSAARLAAAEKASRTRRARVINVSFQLGWMLCVLGMTPFVLHFVGADTTPVAGNFLLYVSALPWSVSILGLALSPLAAIILHRGCVFLFCFCLIATPLIGALIGMPRFTNHNPISISCFAAMLLVIVCGALLLFPTLDTHSCRHASSHPMPPRRKLLRLWLTARLLYLAMGVLMAGLFLAPLHLGVTVAPTWRPDDGQTAFLVNVVSFLLAAAVFTPATRGRVSRWLGSLGGHRDGKDEEAASLASLMGASSAAKVLSKASKTFRAMPLSKLTREELANSTPDPTMNSKTDAAELGTVHAFVSHSWSDAGGAKYDQLHEWAGGEERLIWLDKACIDQRNINDDLACLPVFLSGCQELVCLAGGTYTQRLWCAIELFVFVRMGGKRENMLVWLLEETSDLEDRLAHFDASKAKCFLDRDRQRLLAAIEATFGTVVPFNRLVRDLFKKQRRSSVRTGGRTVELA